MEKNKRGPTKVRDYRRTKKVVIPNYNYMKREKGPTIMTRNKGIQTRDGRNETKKPRHKEKDGPFEVVNVIRQVRGHNGKGNVGNRRHEV